MPSVSFLGAQFGAEKNACYRACDAFIMPSLSEGLPITVLEAWAYAKPVLMTPECNLPEGFGAGAALQIGTRPEEIAAALKQVIEMSDADRRAMGNRGTDDTARQAAPTRRAPSEGRHAGGPEYPVLPQPQWLPMGDVAA